MSNDNTTQTAAAVQQDPRWKMLLARATEADGSFVYGVKTTGVYCRPSCSSRRPRPANVVFFLSPASAQDAGFRACKRCRPDQITGRHSAMIADVCRFIDEQEMIPTLTELADYTGVSAHHLQRVFKAATGMSPRAYGLARRAGRVRQTLPGSESVTAAVYEAGYNSSGRFYAEADAILGMSPGRYRKRGKAMTIYFALGESSLGTLMVAATDQGVCAILLGDDPDALLRDLQQRFKNACLVGGDPAFEHTVALVAGLIEQPVKQLELPLDIRGTVFQERVWQALRNIPPGQTRTYSEIAKMIGSPTSVRAVAGACGANPLAVAIPCHRVVRSDGNLSGYRWGIERKRTLLQREGVQIEQP